MEINPYDVCPLCDSGKKYKFCCRDKQNIADDLFAKQYIEQGQENLRIYTEELLLRGVRLP